MEAIEFIRNYDSYIKEIESIIKPELLPVLEELRTTDPHDIVSPETWFPNESSARGMIWSIFVRRVKENETGLNHQ